MLKQHVVLQRGCASAHYVRQAREKRRAEGAMGAGSEAKSEGSPEEFFEAKSTFSDGDPAGSASAAHSTTGALSEAECEALWPGHCAAWCDRADALAGSLQRGECSVHSLDIAGNSMLHIAAIRESISCTYLLLRSGANPSLKNYAGWSAVDEALHNRSFNTARILHSELGRRSRAQCHSQWPELLETLRSSSDFSMNFRWEFDSSIAGRLLRRHMPSDTQRVYKKDLCLRIDGTFTGFDEESRYVLPRPSHGNYSIVFRGSDTPEIKPCLLFIDREAGTYADLLESGGPFDWPMLNDEGVSESVRKLMLQCPKRKSIKANGLQLRGVPSWCGESPKIENVAGWDAQVYEVRSLFSRTERDEPTSALVGGSFADYVDKYMVRNTGYSATDSDNFRPESPHPSFGGGSTDSAMLASPTSSSQRSSSTEAAPAAVASSVPDSSGKTSKLHSSLMRPARSDNAKARHGERKSSPTVLNEGGFRVKKTSSETGRSFRRRHHSDHQSSAFQLKGRCWLVSDFPLKASDLLSIFALMGNVNKHFKKVERFLRQWCSLNKFPVRIKVPLAFTTFALITCTGFSREELSDDLFRAPDRYARRPSSEVFKRLSSSDF